MVRPALRSRSLRRLKRTTPSGRNVVHYERRRPDKHKCASCKKELQGTPNLRPSKLGKLAKTKRVPNRPYGGNLCSSCLRKTIIQGLR